jgi:effector-binding domain-containing protein
MDIETKVEDREAQNYMAIGVKVQRQEIPETLPPLINQVSDWLEKNNIVPEGPAFFRYLKMEGNMLEVEVGIPVGSKINGNGHIKPGVIPGGRYAVATYYGHYSNLYQVHTTLEKWGKEAGMKFKGARTEFYPTDPNIEPNPDKWQTDITIMLADDHN